MAKEYNSGVVSYWQIEQANVEGSPVDDQVQSRLAELGRYSFLSLLTGVVGAHDISLLQPEDSFSENFDGAQHTQLIAAGIRVVRAEGTSVVSIDHMRQVLRSTVPVVAELVLRVGYDRGVAEAQREVMQRNTGMLHIPENDYTIPGAFAHILNNPTGV